jgi:hypothetical protein
MGGKSSYSKKKSLDNYISIATDTTMELLWFSSLSAVRHILSANQGDSEYLALKTEAMFLRNVVS